MIDTQDIKKLHEMQGSLKTVTRFFNYTPASILGDCVLIAYVNEVSDCASLIELLIQTPMPQKAFPIARAAFEAVQLATLLVTQDDYVVMGTAAWLYYINKDAEHFSKLKSTGVEIDLESDDVPLNTPSKTIATWKPHYPRCDDVMNKAMMVREQLDKKRKPDNWLRQNPGSVFPSAFKKVVASLDMQINTEQYLKGEDITWMNLNRETHTGMRLNGRLSIERNDRSSLVVKAVERDNTTNIKAAINLAISMIFEVRLALLYRLLIHESLLKR